MYSGLPSKNFQLCIMEGLKFLFLGCIVKVLFSLYKILLFVTRNNFKIVYYVQSRFQVPMKIARF